MRCVKNVEALGPLKRQQQRNSSTLKRFNASTFLQYRARFLK
jgi:hypothetical protein